MTERTLIKTKDGETQLINSGDLAGYKGATVVERDVIAAPSHYAKRRNGKWETDRDAKDREEQLGKWRTMDRGELVETLMKEIENLKTRVAKLEGSA